VQQNKYMRATIRCSRPPLHNITRSFLIRLNVYITVLYTADVKRTCIISLVRKNNTLLLKYSNHNNKLLEYACWLRVFKKISVSSSIQKKKKKNLNKIKYVVRGFFFTLYIAVLFFSLKYVICIYVR